ncbi:MAG: CBS domain-containing protein [Candidatus Heimdallarchaeota archaeon]|nr:CBS domain-containing protein [Candidatus Heimdallarchaeota archaeon]
MICLKYLAHSLVEELLVTEYPNIQQSANVSKLISLLEASQSYEAAVINGEQSKVVTMRNVLEVTHPERSSVSSVAFVPPNISHNAPIYEAAIKMVQNKVRILPVFKDESFIGLIKQTTLLEKMIDCQDLKDTTADEIMVPNPITVQRDFSIGSIRTIMSNKGISHTPVVNKEGDLLGMITAGDIVKNYIKPSESQTVGERKGEST